MARLGSDDGRHQGDDPLIGSMVGSFRIQRVLGRGGMGSVYLGEHPIIGNRVAIKLLHESMCTSQELVQRFWDEARAVNLIGHENIVAIHDLALLPPNRYYIVMEYLEGAQLSALLREGGFAPREVVDVLLQLAGALAAAHGSGVVHRDLKPDNVFVVTRAGRRIVKLVDFGVAKLASRDGEALTAAGVLMGTPEYMSPEQCGTGPVDHRTDVYALGVIAYELTTGQLPFTADSVPQLLLAHVRTPPVPPRQLAPGVPEELERVVLKALEKRPEDRFQTMAELSAALAQVRDALLADRRAPEPASAPTAADPVEAPPAAEADGGRPAGPDVTVHLADGKALRLAASEVTRGGMFLRHAGTLPPLRAPLRIAVASPDGLVEVSGEVVRHVTSAEAERWQMAPGFAVQLGPLAPGQRAAVEALAAAPPAPPSPRPDPGRDPARLPEEELGDLERRAASGPYALLRLDPGDGFAEVRDAARTQRSRVERLRGRVTGAEAPRLARVAAALDAAAALLGSPAERLMADARTGNFLGVAHCLTAGLADELLQARHAQFLAEHPGRREEAQRRVTTARIAAKLGNVPVALAEYERALSADPLDAAVHAAYRALKARA